MLPNVPEFSVSEISNAVKKTIEEGFSRVRVRGELSRITIAKSGHLYSDLKDDQAVMNVVCWKGTVNRLSIRPEEGMEVICTGRMTTFPGGSRYQLVIEEMELAGEGALLKLLEERKKKLATEGLFDADRKTPLPFLPKVIGVVTSPTGAVIRDIIHRIRDRFPAHIIVWPVQVQGRGAEDQITRGIQGFNKVTSANRPDVIIVARGGGSLEDLMAFNEENVVRAIAASNIPIISAVGHETDVTLCDFVADVRAPTPTGAAEMAVPVLENIRYQLDDDGHRLTQSVTRTVNDYRRTVDQLSKTFDQPERMLEPLEQRFDSLSDKLNSVFQRHIDQKDRTLHGLTGRLRTPQSLLDQAAMKLDNTGERLSSGMTCLLPPHEDKIESLSRMLESLSYKNTLNRGFAVLKDDKGTILDHVNAVKNADTVTATLKDGETSIK